MSQVYKHAGITAAKMAGRSDAMDEAANEVLAAAKAEAAKHRDTGAYSRSLRTENVRGKSGVRDRLVSATDPGAMSIEFGHFAGKGANKVWVPGKFILINAAARASN